MVWCFKGETKLIRGPLGVRLWRMAAALWVTGPVGAERSMTIFSASVLALVWGFWFCWERLKVRRATIMRRKRARKGKALDMYFKSRRDSLSCQVGVVRLK